MKIGFLPLDTRPCTYDFPIQLARMAEAEVLFPKKGLIGSYKEGTDTIALREWLEAVAPQCDALVISIEQLLHGGLIQSREAKIGLGEQQEQLQVLRRIKKQCPALRIYLSNVLMRTSISTLDSKTLVWWEKVNLYSKLYYREKKFKNSTAAEQCRALEKEIPKEVLETFFRARSSNHAINRECIRLVADGIAKELLILQEDCASEGIQRFEQETLLRDIAEYKVEDKVFMFNGTDEAGAELLQRAIRPEGCKVDVVWLGEQKSFTASYEDRPFIENLRRHMAALNLCREKNAQDVLFILTPKGKQREASLPRKEAVNDYSEKELEDFAGSIFAYAAEGKHCYLLDLDFANGGNTELLVQLARRLPISKLWGYAAWNTASNAMGTLLAQLLASREGNTEMNRSFTAERILDDALYQEQVRQSVSRRVKEAGEDIYNIQDISRTERWLEEEFASRGHFLRAVFGAEIPEFEVKLRWPRLFEVAVFTKKGNGPVFQE